MGTLKFFMIDWLIDWLIECGCPIYRHIHEEMAPDFFRRFTEKTRPCAQTILYRFQWQFQFRRVGLSVSCPVTNVRRWILRHSCNVSHCSSLIRRDACADVPWLWQRNARGAAYMPAGSLVEGLGHAYQDSDFCGALEQLSPDVLPASTSDWYGYQREWNAGSLGATGLSP